MLRYAITILLGFLTWIFLMSSSGCPTDDLLGTEPDLKLESNSSWSEFLTLGAGENFFLLFLESRSYQNFRIPEIRFLAKLMDPVLFICRPYSFRCDSSIFSWWMQSRSVEFSKLINFLLLISELALSTRISGDEIIVFAGGTIFCIKRRSSFMISSGVKWGAFFSRGTAKNSMSSMVAAGEVRTLIVFLLDILYSRKPDEIESPFIYLFYLFIYLFVW